MAAVCIILKFTSCAIQACQLSHIKRRVAREWPHRDLTLGSDLCAWHGLLRGRSSDRDEGRQAFFSSFTTSYCQRAFRLLCSVIITTTSAALTSRAVNGLKLKYKRKSSFKEAQFSLAQNRVVTKPIPHSTSSTYQIWRRHITLYARFILAVKTNPHLRRLASTPFPLESDLRMFHTDRDPSSDQWIFMIGLLHFQRPIVLPVSVRLG